MPDKLINEPIFKGIDLNSDTIIGELVSCKGFQRLQNIVQLGIWYKLFLSVMHSRNNQSLSAYEVTA